MSDPESRRPANPFGLSCEQQGHPTDSARTEPSPVADLARPKIEDATSGSQLGAASGLETLGTAGAPTRDTAGTEELKEVEPGPEGAARADAPTLPRPEVGPTHPTGGFSSTRSTGGFVQHPTDVQAIPPIPLEAVEEEADDRDRREARPRAGADTLGAGDQGASGPIPLAGDDDRS